MSESEKTDVKFYYPDGKSEFKNRNDFIDFYREVYYYNNRDLVLEDKIKGILEGKHGLTEEDIGIILSWKTSQKYISKREVVVTKNSEAMLICVKWVWNVINEYFEQWGDSKDKRFCVIDPFCEESKDKCIDLISKLSKPKGMGIVYALTILYFLSSGRYPIYDRFARIAIDAIIGKKEIGDEVEYCTLSSSAKITFDNDYQKYYSDIKSVFGERYSKREVDQALWMYGHLFKIKQVGRKEKTKINN